MVVVSLVFCCCCCCCWLHVCLFVDTLGGVAGGDTLTTGISLTYRNRTMRKKQYMDTQSRINFHADKKYNVHEKYLDL